MRSGGEIAKLYLTDQKGTYAKNIDPDEMTVSLGSTLFAILFLILTDMYFATIGVS